MLRRALQLFRVCARRKDKSMFVEEPNSIRSIARKLVREILPEEMDAIAAGTESVSSGVADD